VNDARLPVSTSFHRDPLRVETHDRNARIELIMHMVAPRHGLLFRRALERMTHEQLKNIEERLCE
jgi:flavorubredoxin